VPDDRREELAERLTAVRGRIAAACAQVGRDPAEVTMVADNKTYPAADIRRLGDLGVHDVGENRDQEASHKSVELADAGLLVRWHFVGQLQRNTARSVATYADLVHSVDGVALAGALDRAADRLRDRPLEVLVQVSLDEDPHRGGAYAGAADPDRDLDRVVSAIADAGALRLRGVMAVAPLGEDPADAFSRLAETAHAVQHEHPGASVISAGMSADMEAAIAAGATHVRVGSALLGKRAVLR